MSDAKSAQNALRPYERQLEHQINDLKAFTERCGLVFDQLTGCTFKGSPELDVFRKLLKRGEVYEVHKINGREMGCLMVKEPATDIH